MCGIAGIHRSGRAVGTDPQTVAAMSDRLRHRGPDGEGQWRDAQGRCTLGHRRLSIIDTSDAGLQPRVSADGRWAISFNGEIYNFEALRAELEQEGVRFATRTDTEVLVEAIAVWGWRVLDRLDGMFAFAAFDTRTGELHLVRDPFGEKPLYWTRLADGGLAFASELRSLEAMPGFQASVSLDAVAELIGFQCIAAPRSIYAQVQKLEAASRLTVGRGGAISQHRYWRWQPAETGLDKRPIGELADELEALLVDSLRGRLISDVPLGAFLSGGVDSSTVCALIRRRLDRPLTTFSMGFKGAPESEHEAARAFAAHLNCDHHDLVLEPDAIAFLAEAGTLLDEPNGDSSCLPTYLLSQFARTKVTVALSGDGGDELFGGYGRYLGTLEEQLVHQHGNLPGWRPGETYYRERVAVADATVVGGLLGGMPSGEGTRLDALRAHLDGVPTERLLREMRRLDLADYMPGAVLPKVDRMSMACSLEVRTPFLNRALADFAARLPDAVLVQPGRGKLVLREVAYRHLPRELVDLPKQGFALPLSDWARGHLLAVAQASLGPASALRALVGGAGLDDFMVVQATPGRFSPYQLWGVLVLESWLRARPGLSAAGPEQQGVVSPSLLGRLFGAFGRRIAG